MSEIPPSETYGKAALRGVTDDHSLSSVFDRMTYNDKFDCLQFFLCICEISGQEEEQQQQQQHETVALPPKQAVPEPEMSAFGKFLKGTGANLIFNPATQRHTIQLPGGVTKPTGFVLGSKLYRSRQKNSTGCNTT